MKNFVTSFTSLISLSLSIITICPLVIAGREEQPPPCYCCLNEKVQIMTPEECRRQGGTCFTEEKYAIEYCSTFGVTAWCCYDGDMQKTTVLECTRRNLPFYKSEAEAMSQRDSCWQQTTAWCCDGLMWAKTTVWDCKNKNLQYYLSEKEAMKHRCGLTRNIKLPQCCINGELFQYTKEECDVKNGIYYKTGEEASKECSSTTFLKRTVLCCDKGKVVSVSTTDVHLYSKCLDFTYDYDRAKKTCNMGWCCKEDGFVAELTIARCNAAKGIFVYTKNEAERACNPNDEPLCICCIKKQIYRYPVSKCAEKGGKCVSSPVNINQEAINKCIKGK